MMESTFCYAVGFRNWDIFLGIFWYFRNSRAVVNDCLWAFSCFFFRVFNCSFLLFETIRHSLAPYQKLVFTWKYYFEYVIWIQTYLIFFNFKKCQQGLFELYIFAKINTCEIWEKCCLTFQNISQEWC